MNRQKLDPAALEAGLGALEGWMGDTGGIRREFRFADYPSGVAFAVQVALIAQADDHHPDALTIGWRRVTVEYVTHSVGGVTGLDLEAARKVSEIFGT